MRLEVDTARCRGHGQCSAVAPKLFELGPDDRARLLLQPDEDVHPDDIGAAEMAISMCPEAAISWQTPTEG